MFWNCLLDSNQTNVCFTEIYLLFSHMKTKGLKIMTLKVLIIGFSLEYKCQYRSLCNFLKNISMHLKLNYRVGWGTQLCRDQETDNGEPNHHPLLVPEAANIINMESSTDFQGKKNKNCT